MRLLTFLKSRYYSTSKDEELLYEFVADELESGDLNKGLWTKALAETNFEKDKAKAVYVKLRVSSLKAEMKELIPQLKQLQSQKTGLEQLLRQGCTQEAIDYLGSPIHSSEYMRKYRVSLDSLNRGISRGKIKGCLVESGLWVQDKKI